MIRLRGFDYKSPYFYMVTLKRLKGLEAFSEVGPKGLIENDLTRAFAKVIRGFHLKWRCLDEISPFVIMPDHLHLMMKIKDDPNRQSLGRYVYQLEKALATTYWQIVGADGTAHCSTPQVAMKGPASSRYVGSPKKPAPIFAPAWHDWIVKRDGQLAAFRRYIRENPARAWARKANAQFFQRVEAVEFLGRKWFAYGNPEILRLPVITPFKGHRASVEGFSPRWHPTRNKEKFCAQGRMLFLSLYEASTRQPTRKELYERCHEMVDLAISALPGIEA